MKLTRQVYVCRTEKYVLPLLDVVKGIPAWNSAAWLLRYQITALLETFKRLKPLAFQERFPPVLF